MKKLEIIAEIGINHNGSIKLAKKLIAGAASAGADYVKFQSYITKEIVDLKSPLANYQKKQKVKSQFELLKKYELSYNDHIELIKYSKKKKIKFLSSPFDIKSCNWLKNLGLKSIKIPSGEITNFQLLNEVSRSFQNIFLSTGMSNLKEIKDAYKILNKNKKKNIILMHCTSMYPVNPENVNLNFLKRINFTKKIGFSDHSLGFIASIMSLAYGVCLIEKHITLNKNYPGPDHKASMELNEFKNFVKNLRNAVKYLGNENFVRPIEENNNKDVVRKSIFAKTDIKKGEIFTINNLSVKRPGIYLSANKWFLLLGKKSKKNIKINQPILKNYY